MGNLSWILFLINTVFTFVCLTMVVEIVLAVFKCKNYRFRTILRTLPFANLFLLNLLNLGKFLNPFHCNSCMQNFVFRLNDGLQETLGEQNISLIRYTASSYLPNFPFVLVLYMVVSLSMFFFLYKSMQFMRSVNWLSQLIKESKAFQPLILNAKLKQQVAKCDVKFYLSESISSPMAVFDKNILIPTHLLTKISQEELEAVVAHELEHLRWKDPFLKCFIEISSAIFWWVPTKWWFKRLGLDQEMACDAAIENYAINKEVMAAGIVKGAKVQHSLEQLAVCKLSNNCIVQRMSVLLNRNDLPKKMLIEIMLIASIILVSLACMIIN